MTTSFLTTPRMPRLRALIRLHPETQLTLLALVIFLGSIALVASLRTVALVGLIAVGWWLVMIAPTMRCEVCFRGFAVWGSKRFRVRTGSGRRWVATRRCWLHRHELEVLR